MMEMQQIIDMLNHIKTQSGQQLDKQAKLGQQVGKIEKRVELIGDNVGPMLEMLNYLIKSVQDQAQKQSLLDQQIAELKQQNQMLQYTVIANSPVASPQERETASSFLRDMQEEDKLRNVII